ncbi:MAG TPA: NADH:flavin oxidoreductase/NADH oxidase [Armatimonadota bacterium]|jgi:2,4-dienoyl-CoA reductase-like NADH-dependent reductase (Old Yellow Enzyme family)
MSTVGLYTPLEIRSVTFRNRIGVSPMCQYSSHDGFATDWHLVHLGSRAVGGAGLVMTEASAVTPDGRISPQDLGIWNDAQIEGLSRCARFIEAQGAVAGIQLAHAGRKASTPPPWDERKVLSAKEGGWRPIWAPSPIPFSPESPIPQSLSREQIREIVSRFSQAAGRAREAGFRVVEIHAAHGYLLHEFLSPLSNQRSDEYGGSFENRTRIVREVTSAIRATWPGDLPLFIRISASDWAEGGWDADQSVALAQQLKSLGIDLVDCSSGGAVPGVKIPAAPGYQVPFAERIRREADLATAAVGLIREPTQADEIIRRGQADLVLLAREMLRDPYWPQHATRHLGVSAPRPIQYGRAAD